MGGSSSTRRVTVINETNPDVIKISDEVARRLQGTGTHSQAPASPPISFTASDFDTRKQLTEDRKKTDDSWHQQLQELQRQNDSLYKLATYKFNEAVDAVHEKHVRYSCIPVCESAQNLVLECYKKNKTQPLKCAKEVEQFSKCVHQSRNQIAATK